MPRSVRNLLVEQAVDHALERIDHFINGGLIDLPDTNYRRAGEQLLDEQSASVKTATLFLLFYWLVQPEWDMRSVPRGARGRFGDKRLSEQRNRRGITLHNRIVAFGENLGWKGDVSSVDVSTDTRFRAFIAAIAGADYEERAKIADYFAQAFADSRREDVPLPAVGDDVLTFVRAKALVEELLHLRSEGHIQQFLVAALLHEYRIRQGIDVRTHHPHAADLYDATSGDIEEFHQRTLVRSYEITMRSDWKNRLSSFRDKMDRFNLSKYVIIAAEVNSDEQLSEPAQMALLVAPQRRDIAIVDIHDVVNYLIAILSATELRNAVNRAYDYLANPTLSGRDDFKTMYRDTVRNWLDLVGEQRHREDNGSGA